MQVVTTVAILRPFYLERAAAEGSEDTLGIVRRVLFCIYLTIQIKLVSRARRGIMY